MASESARIGIVAGELVLGWQHGAIEALRAGGAVIAARFEPRSAGIEGPLRPPVARLAGRAAASFVPRSWDVAPVAPDALAAELDVVLLLAEPRDEAALASARWGVWELVLPGDPPAFAAVEGAWPAVEVRLECRSPQRGVIVQGAVAVDRTSYPRTLERVARLAASLPADAVRRFRAGPAARTAPQLRTVPEKVGAARAALLGARCSVRRAGSALARRIVHARWRIGVLRTSAAELPAGGSARITWVDLPRGRFWADPFPFVWDGRRELLCEGYDYGRDRGFLASFPLSGERVVGPPRVLGDADHHRSYPYVVADGPRRYVLPEQSQARRVVLYELEGDGLREAGVLLDGIAAADPTLIRHGQRWWLFCTDVERNDNGELLLFHAPELRGPWLPHPLNPIVRDVRSARPAGTPFEVDGALYRPAQDCSTGYGARIALARIDQLDVSSYHETVVAHLTPPRRGRGRHGLHTVAMLDGLCFVDGKDLVLDPAATWAMLRADLRRICRPIALGAARTFNTEIPHRS